jgi:Fe-S oxidoreductase
LDTIAELTLANANATADNCRYCLMCRHVCPVGHVTKVETLTPHGWGLIIASERRGMLEWNEENAEIMYQCADCGTCRANCVTDQPFPDTVARVREELVGLGLAPKGAQDAADRLRKWGNPYEEKAPEAVSGTGDVALFVGDEAAYVRPVGLAAAKTLLEAAGINVVTVGVGRSNGYIASSLGYREVAEEIARANLADILATGAKRVIVLSPGDQYAFTTLYPDRLGVEWPSDVEVVELVSVLAADDSLSFSQGDADSTYTYVDPTHAVRLPDRHDAPRALASRVLGGEAKELFWRKERAHPVGNSALQFSQPEIADKLTWARLEDAKNVGADLIVTEDAGTLAQLDTHASRFGVEVRGLYELLAASLDR